MLKEGLRISFYSTIEEFYSDIQENQKNGMNLSPFQFQNWQELLYLEHIKQHRGGKYLSAILWEKNNPLVGGHFFYKNRGRRKGLFLLGTGTDTDYNDLIFFSNNTTLELIDKLICSTLDKTKQDTFIISQIPQNSMLIKWAEWVNAKHEKSNPCAQIFLKNNYDEYLKSLSKSTRQNLRTASNRLKSDNKKYSISWFNNPLKTEEAIELQSLYEKRRVIKNSNKSFQSILKEKVRLYQKGKFNLAKEAMVSIDNIYCGVIRIDGDLAAYFFGLKDELNRICVMQVAVNDDFARYSPGMLLISNTIEKLIQQGEIKCFDLTNGDEKYKFSLGAEPHSTEYYVYNRKEFK
jgi:hypothetical protein